MVWDIGSWWMHGLGFGVHGVFMLLFWGLLIWLAVAAFRLASRGPAPATLHSEGALDILAARYARGELSREQFEAMRGTLRRER
jgi:putative membrane protein